MGTGEWMREKLHDDEDDVEEAKKSNKENIGFGALLAMNVLQPLVRDALRIVNAKIIRFFNTHTVYICAPFIAPRLHDHFAHFILMFESERILQIVR